MNFLRKKSVIVGILVLIIVGFFFLNSEKKSGKEEVVRIETFSETLLSSETAEEVKIPERRAISANEKEYISVRHKFSLYYPKTLEVQEFDEGGGATTVVFQSPEEGLGFQIFIAPFGEKQITEERFRQDVPSGVRNELREVIVGGVAAASFYSMDALLGETAEVWFIRDGLLFEVMAPKVLAPWLSSIIETWLFL